MEEDIEEIHNKYYQINSFTEIDHVPSEFVSENFRIDEICLLINYDAFDKYYPSLIKIVTNKNTSTQEKLKASDILLTMNGQNEKAWNVKKQAVIDKKVNLQRQLWLNATTLLKFKKSTSCYEYRLRVITSLLQNKSELQNIKQIHKKEHQLIVKVLNRFIRNYFCWTYRLKLINFLTELDKTIIDSEVEMIHEFIDVHPNDHSAISYLRSLLRKHKISTQNEIKWSQKLLQFCEVAYENPSQYKHLLNYRQQLS